MSKTIPIGILKAMERFITRASRDLYDGSAYNGEIDMKIDIWKHGAFWMYKQLLKGGLTMPSHTAAKRRANKSFYSHSGNDNPYNKHYIWNH